MGEMLSIETDGQIIVEAMNLMGYDAMAVGRMELIKGIDVLLERAAEATFEIVSCNLVWAESHEPVLKPYTVIEREGLRFGILGVTDETALQGVQHLSSDVELVDPVAQVERYLPELYPLVDVVIVLSQLGLHEDKVLAQAVDGIDIIVGGQTRQIMREPQIVQRTMIIQVGFDGQWMGRLNVGGYLAALEPLDYQVLYMRPDIADDPAMLQLIQRHQEN